MKKWKKYLRNSSGLLLLLIGLVQCDFFANLGDKEEVFDPYEHPLFEEGDTLVYESIADIDSFYVSKSKVYKPHTNPADGGSEDTEYWGTFHEIGGRVTTQICFDIYIHKYIMRIKG